MVKALSPDEVLSHLQDGTFAVSHEHSSYRIELYRSDKAYGDIGRVGRFFNPEPSQFALVFLSLAELLGTGSSRILWVDHFDRGFRGLEGPFLNLVGNDLPDGFLKQKPGVLIEPLSENILDDLKSSKAEKVEAETLCALCALANLGNWDVKLLAAGTTDYVEFWEGQVFFYSDNLDALERAEEVFEFYELRTPISFAREMIT